MNGPFDFIDRSRVARGIQFATNRDRCVFLGTSSHKQIRWLNDHPDKWRCIEHIPSPESVPRSSLRPSGGETRVRPAEQNARASSFGFQKSSTAEPNPVLINSPDGNCHPSDEPTSPPAAAARATTQRTEKDDQAPRTEATTSDAMSPKTTSAAVNPIESKHAHGGKHATTKKKRRPGLTRRGAKRSPERLLIILESLREKPCLMTACRKARMHPNTLYYWLKRSAAGAVGYDLEWLGWSGKLHEHYEAAMEDGRESIQLILWERGFVGYDKILTYRGHVTYQVDPVLWSRGLRGSDAYLRDQNGAPIPETVRRFDRKARRLFLKRRYPEQLTKDCQPLRNGGE
jgi:hypothetical protein